MELNKIYNEECIVGMDKIPDKSIDMILCDLPYENTQNKWDLMIDPEELWKQYKRIIKDRGAIVLFGQGKFTGEMMLSQPKLHRYNLIWEKDRPSGFLNAKRMPLRSHEDIMVFYKKLPTYNPQFWEGEPLHGLGTKYKEKTANNNNYGEFDDSNEIRDARKGSTQKYPRSVLRFQRPHPPIHPTQKPVELCEWLINTYTNEGEVVLDNCMGSATTAIAALNTGRNYIGFELDEEYYNLANKRIENYINK